MRISGLTVPKNRIEDIIAAKSKPS
jgi:hypothetical protein